MIGLGELRVHIPVVSCVAFGDRILFGRLVPLGVPADSVQLASVILEVSEIVFTRTALHNGMLRVPPSVLLDSLTRGSCLHFPSFIYFTI